MSEDKNKKVEYMREASKLCDNSSCGYKIGCVAVKNGQIIFKTWNETLPGEIFCQNGTCVREVEGLSGGKNIDRVCTLHAEASVVAQSSVQGISLVGAEIYVTTFPCLICTRLLIKARISKLFYMSDYMGSNEGLALFEANSIAVEKISEQEVWKHKC